MEKKKYKVGPKMFVAFSYILKDSNTGEVLFEVDGNAPDTMVYGVTQEIVPGLSAAINGLARGDRFAVTLPPEAAFGQRQEQQIMKLDREIFTRDGKLAEEVTKDAYIPMITQEGFRIDGKVLEIGDTHVTMDFNHRFAGLTVSYDGEIVDVRPATDEELQPHHGCCSGCGGGCGDGGCGGCGGGC